MNNTGQLKWDQVQCQYKQLLHGPSMFAVKVKIMECSINSPALSLLMKHLVIGQRLKLLISRIFIGHHAVGWFLLVSIS